VVYKTGYRASLTKKAECNIPLSSPKKEMLLKLVLVVPTPKVDVPIPVTLFSGPFTERLQNASRLGYDGVELMPARPHQLDAPSPDPDMVGRQTIEFMQKYVSGG
jgi:hypothetical protein